MIQCRQMPLACHSHTGLSKHLHRRKAKEDMTLMGYRIPKGMTLVMPPYALHLSAANYVHPAKFWPERWLPESSADDTVLDPGTTSEGLFYVSVQDLLYCVIQTPLSRRPVLS